MFKPGDLVVPNLDVPQGQKLAEDGFILGEVIKYDPFYSSKMQGLVSVHILSVDKSKWSYQDTTIDDFYGIRLKVLKNA